MSALDDLQEAEANARRSGIEAARMEAEYQAAKFACVADMKAAKTPATIISLTVKGDKSVNSALLARDMAAVEYRSDMELINVIKKRVDTLREQMQREWTAR